MGPEYLPDFSLATVRRDSPASGRGPAGTPNDSTGAPAVCWTAGLTLELGAGDMRSAQQQGVMRPRDNLVLAARIERPYPLVHHLAKLDLPSLTKSDLSRFFSPTVWAPTMLAAVMRPIGPCERWPLAGAKAPRDDRSPGIANVSLRAARGSSSGRSKVALGVDRCRAGQLAAVSIPDGIGQVSDVTREHARRLAAIMMPWQYWLLEEPVEASCFLDSLSREPSSRQEMPAWRIEWRGGRRR